MGAIDIGSAATSRGFDASPPATLLSVDNPANDTGQITSVEVWAKSANLSGFRVGMFFLVSGTTYECRDSETLGTVTYGSKQTFSGRTIAVATGDLIGCYWPSGGNLAMSDTGGAGQYYIGSEHIDPSDQATYTLFDGDRLSLYGTGETLAVEQAVGGGSIAIAGTLGLLTKLSVGAGSIAIAGVLGRLIKLSVGAGSVTIAGALSAALTFFQVVGSGAVAIVGSLSSVLTFVQAVGSGSIAIAGSLNRLIKIGVGAGSIAISGALGRVLKIAVGGGSVAITGSLALKIKLAVGDGAVAITGTLIIIREFIALTLRALRGGRGVGLTLQKRGQALTLGARSFALTLRDRAFGEIGNAYPYTYPFTYYADTARVLTLKVRSFALTLIRRTK